MINFETEYFSSPYYFFLKKRNNGDLSLYYSSSIDTLNESRKNDTKIDFPKEAEKELKAIIKKLMGSKTKSKKGLGLIMNKLKQKYKKTKDLEDDGELTELINADGSFSQSAVPMLDMTQHTDWTQDMRAALVRQAGDTFPFKSRIYYGESEEDKKVLDEEDFSDAYGYEEIVDDNVKSFKDCVKIFDDLEIKDPFERYERCMSFGFDPELDDDGQQRIVELRKEKMRDLIDELLLKQKNDDKEIYKDGTLKKDDDEFDVDDDSVILKILKRNLDAVKKLAEKEDIDINKLVKHLKTGE